MAIDKEYLNERFATHYREHEFHEKAHEREHEFTETALGVAATLAKENKADANEWRQTMRDKDERFMTKAEVVSIESSVNALNDAEIRRVTEEKNREIRESRDRTDAAARVARQQWTVGLAAVIASIIINLVLRLLST